MKNVSLGGKMIGDGHPVFILAEIGSNFDGSFEDSMVSGFGWPLMIMIRPAI